MTQANPLHPTRYLHTIHAAPECDRLRQIYTHVFGGITFHESYFAPQDRDAALLYVADHMIEVMAPRHVDDMNFMYARYLAKAGAGYHSISFRIDDVRAGRERCDELGVKINTEGPGLIFLHPKSTGGLIMELTEHRMPNDPWDLPNWRRDWAAGRPAKPHALAHIVCAPRYPEDALKFLVEVLDGKAGPARTIAWPELAKATPVEVADMTLLILQPEESQRGACAICGRHEWRGLCTGLASRGSNPNGQMVRRQRDLRNRCRIAERRSSAVHPRGASERCKALVCGRVGPRDCAR